MDFNCAKNVAIMASNAPMNSHSEDSFVGDSLFLNEYFLSR